MSEIGKRDTELVKRALSGDQRAYTQLLGHYRESVFYMMRKMIGNSDDAEDLTIEAFGKAFKRLESYDVKWAFSTWLFKIATNNCIDYLRKKKNMKNSLSIESGYDDNEDDGGIDIKADDLNPEENLMKTQRIKEMHRIVEQLKPKYRMLVELRYFKELSYEEIAAKLEIPLGTVKAQLFRARELMFEILKHSVNKF